MNARMVTDTRNNVLVVFGGDGQSHYLADTWLFDLRDTHVASVQSVRRTGSARGTFHGLRSR